MSNSFVWLPHTGQKGASMIEVLVAIVVFSIGMLGLAGLQTAALRGHVSAWARENVAALIADLAERMRSNPNGVQIGAYRYTPHYTSSGMPQGVVAPPQSCAATQSPAQRAICDLYAAHDMARRRLPGGFINVAADGRHAMRITVMWADKDAPEAGIACTPASSASPLIPAKTCCPPDTPAGIRCLNSMVMP